MVTLPSADPAIHLVNRAYTFHAPGVVQSTALSPPDVPIHTAVLQVQDFWGAAGPYLTSSATTAPIGTRSSRGKLSFSLSWHRPALARQLVTTPVLEIIRIDYATSEQTSQ